MISKYSSNSICVKKVVKSTICIDMIEMKNVLVFYGCGYNGQ